MSFSCLVFFCFQLWKKGLGGNDKLQSITDRHFLDIEVLNSFWGILILAFSRVWDPLIRRGWNPCKQAVSKEGDYPLYIPVSRPCFLSPLQFRVLQSSKSSKLKLKHQLLLSVGFWIAPTRIFFLRALLFVSMCWLFCVTAYLRKFWCIKSGESWVQVQHEWEGLCSLRLASYHMNWNVCRRGHG